jgi:hypothetical protein
MPTLRPQDVLIATTAAKLAGLIDDALSRAVRRAIAYVLTECERRADWITAREAVHVYGESRSTLDRWRRDGQVASKGGVR